MRKLQCPAIVLRRWPYSESSLTLRLLTPELGSIPVLAKGVNKLKSGSVGVLDTWALVNVHIGGPEDREMLDLYSVELLDRMSGLSSSTERLAAAGVLAELGELAAPPGQAAPQVFLWLQRWLQELSETERPRLTLVGALMEGLELLGLAPRLAPDGADPEADRASEQTLWFSPSSGGVVAGDQRPGDHARRIGPATRLLMRTLQEGGKAENATCEAVDDCLTILGEFLHYHLERPPKAWRALVETQAAAT